MTIYVTPPTAPAGHFSIDVPIISGGTSADTADQAVRNLGGILSSTIDQVGGPISLNGAGKIIIPAPQLLSDFDITLAGPDSIPPSGQVQYKITNFHYLLSYTVSVSAGTVSIAGDTITVTAPATGSSVILTVNTKTYSIPIAGAKPVTPTIISPSNGTSNQPITITVVGTSFSMPSGYSDTHKETKVQWSRDSAFTTLLGNVTTPSAVTQYNITNLPYQTTVFVRIAYVGTLNGSSNWSPVISFTTQGQGSEITEMMPTGGVSPGSIDPWTGELTTWTYANLSSTISSQSLPVEVQALNTPGGAVGPIYANTLSISGSGLRAVHVQDSGVVTVYSISANVYTPLTTFTIQSFTPSTSGNPVAMNFAGTCFVIGEPNASPSGFNNSGKVHVFREISGTWTEDFNIYPNNATLNGKFGGSVCMNYNGSMLAVGAVGNNSGKGSVSLYVKSQSTASSWDFVSEFTDPNGVQGDAFGQSIKLAGNSSRLVVGAPNATQTGRAYVYRMFGSIWGLETELVPSIPASVGSGYGTKVEISGIGNAIAISRLAQIYPSAAKADVTTFVWNGTEYVNKSVIVGMTDTRFGLSTRFAGNGTALLIGSPDKMENNVSKPQLVLYTWTTDPSFPSAKTWVQQGTIRPVTDAANSDFGAAIVSSADLQVIGSRAPLIGKTFFFRQPITP